MALEPINICIAYIWHWNDMAVCRQNQAIRCGQPMGDCMVGAIIRKAMVGVAHPRLIRFIHSFIHSFIRLICFIHSFVVSLRPCRATYTPSPNFKHGFNASDRQCQGCERAVGLSGNGR